jgi:acetyltransferase-like isoleucine patch superfamily enzyme
VPAAPLTPSDRAQGLLLGPGVRLPDDAWIGGGVIIHGGVELAPGCVIQDHAVLGARLGRDERHERPHLSTRIGAGATICTAALVSEAVIVGERSLIGDQARLEQQSQIGADSVIGRLVAVSHDVQVGDRVHIQHVTNIAPPGIVEDDVFVGPGVVSTNDNTADRMNPEDELVGPVLRRGCRIGAAVTLLPAVEIGEEALVAAGSLVTRDVPARTVVMGRPARPVRAVADADLLPTPGA